MGGEVDMQANVGGVDRIIRIVLGIAIIAWGVAYKSWWGAVGLLPLATGLFSFCPAYTLFGSSTCKR